MKYDNKTITITNDILRDWYQRFEDKDMTLHDDVNYIIPGFVFGHLLIKIIHPGLRLAWKLNFISLYIPENKLHLKEV